MGERLKRAGQRRRIGQRDRQHEAGAADRQRQLLQLQLPRLIGAGGEATGQHAGGGAAEPERRGAGDAGQPRGDPAARVGQVGRPQVGEVPIGVPDRPETRCGGGQRAAHGVDQAIGAGQAVEALHQHDGSAGRGAERGHESAGLREIDTEQRCRLADGN